MAANVKPVVFPNADGKRLFGLLHTPAVNLAPGIAVVLLSPGIKSRVGPHRLYVKLARRLCDAGFVVLRFDFYGLGDAEGELDETLVANVYASVAAGRYLSDTVAAMNWLQQEHRVGKFVLAGLCGGAITGLFAGAQDRRVISLVGLGIPVTQYSEDTSRYQFLTEKELDHFRRNYVKRALNWKSWVRLLTFRSDYKVMTKAFLAPLKRVWRRDAAPASAAEPTGPPDLSGIGNVNPHFSRAFFSMLSGSRKMLLLFGESDRLYWEFDEKFFRRSTRELDRYGSQLEISLIGGARHVFEAREQQEELFGKILEWLAKEYYPASATEASA